MKKLLISLGLVILLTVGIVVFGSPAAWWFQPTDESEQIATTTSQVATTDKKTAEEIQVAADNLSVPWGLAFLPNGNLLVTERTGQLLELTPEGDRVNSQSIDSSVAEGESGLLGVAVHPNFAENRWVYLYETTESTDGLENRVVRFQYEDNELFGREVIIDGIAGAAYHDGGRIAFGPDGFLFITTGDAGNEAWAQNTDTLEGKILRVSDDGSIPSANPFGNAVYSYGHRNPQGLAWDQSGRLFITEHGRSGARSGLDEVNLIQAGENYGWPYLEGDEDCQQPNIYSPDWPDSDCDAVGPLTHSGPDITWAPASAAIDNDVIYFGGLRGQSIYSVPIINSGTELKLGEVQAHYKSEYGRIRTVAVGPSDKYLYVTTSNTDGRGQPETDDDKILRIPLSFFSR